MIKAAWLVDMGYVVKAAKVSGMRVDYLVAQGILAARYGSVRTFLFNSYDAKFGIPAGLKGFYTAMEHRGMVVRLHPMSGGASGEPHKQRRVDVDVACHAVWQATSGGVDHLILTTGDQDLIPAVEMCRSTFGKAVVLFTFRDNVSDELVRAADEQMLFEDFRSELERSKPPTE